MPLNTGLAKEFEKETRELQSPEGDGEEQLSLLAQESMLGEVKRGERVMTAGRPKGARNKRVQELAKYLLSRHRDPLEGAMQITDAPIEDLAGKLECTKLEAAYAWLRYAEFIARYVHQAQPQAFNVNTPLAGYLTVVNMAAQKPGEDGDKAQLSPYGLDVELRPNDFASGGGCTAAEQTQ